MARTGKGPGLVAIIILSPLGAIGSVAGQVVFDILNNLTDGFISGVLVSYIIMPVSSLVGLGGLSEWSALNLALMVPRWALGTATVALSYCLALNSTARKTVALFTAGCAIGGGGWLSAGYALEALPPGWRSPVISPSTLQFIVPPALVCLLLSLTMRETRPQFLKFLLGGLMAGIAAILLNLIPLDHTINRVISPEKLSAIGISSARIAPGVFVFLPLNAITLFFLRTPSGGAKNKTGRSD